MKDVVKVYRVNEDLIVLTTDDTFALNPEQPNTWTIEDIKVPEHMGTWYTIDCLSYGDNTYFLCEHEEYGDETPYMIIDQNGRLILDEVYNGFEDLADLWGFEIEE